MSIGTGSVDVVCVPENGYGGSCPFMLLLESWYSKVMSGYLLVNRALARAILDQSYICKLFLPIEPRLL